MERPSPNVVRLVAQTVAPAGGRPDGFRWGHTTTIYGDGRLTIDNIVEVDEALPPLPRIGLTMRLPAGFEHFSWFGREPHENYSDRKPGAAGGLYRGMVDEQHLPHIMPQENGNKTDVRWLELRDGTGLGLRVAGTPLMEVSVSHYTAADLTRALHTNELVRRDEIILNLDHRQSGLGGASCGPGTCPQYLIQPGSYRFSLRFQPVTAGPSPGNDQCHG